MVGPNGCGKSNLVEALRWVMGESSYKNMRGSGMDDVIFSGGGSRPARNLAEVALVLDNSARTAPAAFNDSETIEVTRRIDLPIVNKHLFIDGVPADQYVNRVNSAVARSYIFQVGQPDDVRRAWEDAMGFEREEPTGGVLELLSATRRA